MRFITLGSSSKGNGYVLTNGREALVIEGGVILSKVKKALDFKIGGINGLIASHAHRDHSKYIKEYLNTGIDVFASQDVFDSYQIEGHSRAKPIERYEVCSAGNFRFMPFPVEHDVPCFGYLIRHPETGTILFATDTYMLNFEFKELHHILIEANYCDEILQRNIDSGRLAPIVRNRVFNSHIELQTCKRILQGIDMKSVQNIVLIHLSDGNSDAKRFINEISSATGKPVYVADKGFEIELTKMR